MNWFWLIFQVVVAIITAPKVRDTFKGAELSDVQFPTSTEGRVIPIAWGTVMIKGPNLVWYGDFAKEKITKKVKSGFLGMSSKRVTLAYKYILTLHFALCFGPGCVLKRIRVKEKDLWGGTNAGNDNGNMFSVDRPMFFGNEPDTPEGMKGDFYFYNGSSTQLPNKLLQSETRTAPGLSTQSLDLEFKILKTYLKFKIAIAIGNPLPEEIVEDENEISYRGLCHIVYSGYTKNSPIMDPWEFLIQRIPNPLGLANNGIIYDHDANPVNVIYEILTNDSWGLGIPSSKIDSASFISVGNTLATEGNGFSYLLNSQKKAGEIINEIEKQIDGSLYLDKLTGKWKMSLVRFDYDIDSVPNVNRSNLINITSFKRNSWSETVNELKLSYLDKDKTYNETYALAQDGANILIQGATISNEIRYYGVSNAKLANDLVWRDLRTYSFPIVQATIVVDRSFWDINYGSVISWTNDELEIDKAPFRVIGADFGDFSNSEISLDLVEDVFYSTSGVFSSPKSGYWISPNFNPVNFPEENRLIIEAPKAFMDKDLEYVNVPNRIYSAIIGLGINETSYDIYSGDVAIGISTDFVEAGVISSELYSYNQQGNIQITGGSSTVESILSSIASSTSVEEAGINLINLAYVGGEFLNFRGYTSNSSGILLTNVTRGILDSIPLSHSGGSRIWFLTDGGNITSKAMGLGTSIIKPVPNTTAGTLDLSMTSGTSVVIANRHLKPYPPSYMKIGGTAFNLSSVSLESSVSTVDDLKGFELSWVRRDFETTNEILGILNENYLPTNFPAKNDTKYSVKISRINNGIHQLSSGSYENFNLTGISRTDIIYQNSGVLPENLRAEIKTRHVVDGTTYHADLDLKHDFPVISSELLGYSSLGNINENVTITAYDTILHDGSYLMNVKSDIINDPYFIQFKINTGDWTNAIGEGSTSHNITGLLSGDALYVRHTDPASNGGRTLLKINPPAGSGRYGIIVT